MNSRYAIKQLSILLSAFLACGAIAYGCKTAEQDSISNGKSSSSKRFGTWMTNVGSKVMYSKASIDSSLERASELGLNSIYPVVWNKEEVFLQSDAVKNHLGSEFISAPEGMDVLLEVIKSAINRGMTTYAWYENGLKVPVKWENGNYFKLGKALSDKGWLTKNRSGNLFGKCEFGVCKGFLNPLHPEVRSFLVEFVEEIARYYGVKGVMIDDHFSMDPEFGYDSLTRSKYYEHIKSKGIRESHESWKKFRSDAIVSLMKEMKAAVNRHGKKFILSPGGDPDWAKEAWLQDWEKAVNEYAADEIIMQSYRYNMFSFRSLINNSKVKKLSKKMPFGVAVLFGLKNNTKSSGKLIYQQTEAALKSGYDVSYFYLDTIDTPASQEESRSERATWMNKVSTLIKSH